MGILTKLFQHKLTKITGKGIGALLALVGGLTTIEAVQPAVEKASDYGARAVAVYCELPAVDRERFHSEVAERLGTALPGAAVLVTCP